MNTLEINALSQALSNEARVLYCLYLKPKAEANTHTVLIDNKSILALLNSHSVTLHLGRQISALFKELFDAGLIDVMGDYSFERSLNKHTVKLLLVELHADFDHSHLHQEHTKILISWRPDPLLFEQICQLVGVIDAHFDADELGEFIAYWMGRPEIMQSPYQWTQKFVLHLKQRRLRQPSKSATSKAGHQWTEAHASIEFDDNVKKLIQKYSESS